MSWVDDLDGDGRDEVLFAADKKNGAGSLTCYSAAGNELWTLVPGKAVRTAAEASSPPFFIGSLAVDGKFVRDEWRSGHLQYVAAADLDGDRRPELYAGGVSNGYQAATVVELDPETMDGASIFTLGARGRILDASSSGNMATAHRTLERTGHLGHSFSQAERDALKNVRVITGTSLQ